MATADDVPRFEIILSDTDLEKIVKDKDSKETQKVIKWDLWTGLRLILDSIMHCGQRVNIK